MIVIAHTVAWQLQHTNTSSCIHATFEGPAFAARSRWPVAWGVHSGLLEITGFPVGRLMPSV